MLDGCSCCKVCARQAGEPCSFLEPCDHHKDLYCDYGVLSDTETGICMGEYSVAFWKVIECYVKRREFKCFALHFLSTSRSLLVLGSCLIAVPCVAAQEGQTCDLGGVIYRSGETFQPSCKHHCVCMNGEIGCVPTCASNIRLPSPDCPYPRRIQIPGKCCEEWVCDQIPQEDTFQSAMAGRSIGKSTFLSFHFTKLKQLAFFKSPNLLKVHSLGLREKGTTYMCPWTTKPVIRVIFLKLRFMHHLKAE